MNETNSLLLESGRCLTAARAEEAAKNDYKSAFYQTQANTNAIGAVAASNIELADAIRGLSLEFARLADAVEDRDRKPSGLSISTVVGSLEPLIDLLRDRFIFRADERMTPDGRGEG